MTLQRSMRVGIAGIGLLAALAAGPLAAHAQSTVCRTDPIFWLTNSHKVQLSFSLPSSAVSTVTAVHYDVHIPAGVQLSGYNDPTTDPLYKQTTWTVYNDAAPNEYEAVAYVTTTTSPISISLTNQVVLQTSKGPGWSGSTTSNGTTNQYWVVADYQNAQ